MLPRYGEWDEKLRSTGLTVLGVHTPETDGERDLGRLHAFVRARRIRWAVVADPSYAIWRQFQIEAWPTIVLVDRRGRLRDRFVGEGHVDAIVAALTKLLAEK